MEHVLDNPGYNALLTGNKHLAQGNDEVKYFAKDVSLFCGLKDKSVEQLQALYNLVPHDGPVGFINNHEAAIPAIWNVVHIVKAYQMIYDLSQTPAAVTVDLVPLTDEHIPQMLALTKLTNPGPFTQRTIDFGHYLGIFDGDRLVAMAGQRLHVFEYAEISAVCTHPDYLGRGYAKQLLLAHIHRIKAAAGIPMLHVRTDNERAVKVYESIGFKARTHMYFNIMMKNKQG